MSTPTQLPPSSDPRTAAEWIEFYYAQGWSDGLPLVPPTEASVSAMLAAGGVSAEDILGSIAERNAIIPAEKVAINAVLAGCLPAYFPVVLAAVQALCHPDFHYHNPATSNYIVLLSNHYLNPFAIFHYQSHSATWFAPNDIGDHQGWRHLRLFDMALS